MKIYKKAVQIQVDPNNPDQGAEQSNAANAANAIPNLQAIIDAAGNVNSSIDALADALDGADLSSLKQNVSDKIAEALPQSESFKDIRNNVKFSVEDLFDQGKWADIQRRMTTVLNQSQQGADGQESNVHF